MRTLRERSPSVHPDIVLVEINDATIRDLKEIVGRWPWPRAVSAMLIDYLHRGAPKVIAVDIGFWEKEREASYQFNGEAYTSARSDGDLAEAVKRAGNVVLLADAVDPGLVGSEVPQEDWSAPPYHLGPEIEERPVITLPYDVLAAAAAGFGHNFLAIDRDGPARRIPPFVRKGTRFMPSLGMAAALVGRWLSCGGCRSRRSRDTDPRSSTSRSFACRSPTPSTRRSGTTSRRCSSTIARQHS